MSRGIIQSELDRFQKPINMGTVYITSNGGENSKVKAQKIYHATVAGESRLVNEVDLKSAMRKALLLADEEQARNVVVIPADCGTHDINDTARVQLAAIKTYLSTAKNSNIKNIFLVMEDEESYQVYEEYYNRIFL
jgi:O-acetyl-ADP-ribose deacetylase (regulator of RNase III)